MPQWCMLFKRVLKPSYGDILASINLFSYYNLSNGGLKYLFVYCVCCRYGRKKLCLSFTLVYTVSCLMKLSRNYGVLLVARLFSGFATSLLFSAFEAWYVHEHVQRHDFPTEWISVTFSKSLVWNSALAITAGIMATAVAEWMNFGPVSPFLCAIPCLMVTAVYIALFWEENYSQEQKTSFKKACNAAVHEIITEPKIFVIGAIQSLFESVMYIFVFIWTPILNPAGPPLGIVFACFMICIMIGSALYTILSERHVPVSNLLGYAIAFAFLANCLCILATHPDHTEYVLAFFAFLLFETAAGVYFPAMSYLRSKLIPDAYRRSISNCFRIPLNLIACVVLMMLHNDTFRHGNRLIFVTCTALLGLAALLVGKLIAFTRDDAVVMQARYSEETNQLVENDA